MAGRDELSDFVRDALARGVPRPQVEAVLRTAGWSAEQVHDAMSAFADVEFVLPVPKPRPYLSAREAFMYLVLFSMLYFAAFNLGSLIFSIIDRLLPDAALNYPNARPFADDAIRWSVSALVVSFPVFLYVSWQIGREVAADANKRASKVRRWLTYLTLFSAASILVGDVTTLVYNVLGGELTERFALKVATVAAIAGTGFWYYLSDLRHVERGRGGAAQ
jgi:hypothetical protein